MGHVDVRTLCATNRNPFEEVKARQFREELYYRLNIVSIEVPALREREEDILMLANHFMTRLCTEKKLHQHCAGCHQTVSQL